MTTRRKIPAHELAVGMYIAELDRPWLDTPFLFQGFAVRNEREIEEICRYCRWVYVEGQGAQAGNVQLLASNLTETTSVREELPHAEDSLRYAQEMIGVATRELRVTETIQIKLVEKAIDPIIESVLRNKDAMIWLQNMRSKDEYTFSRSLACSVWATIFGRHLGLDRETLRLLATGALLLDVGKTCVPDELLTRPGPLTAAEMQVIRQHVDHGVEILTGAADIDPRIVEMVRTHHERFNGTGYPCRLRGVEIPSLGKIAGILDTFVAMTSARPYADPSSTYDVMRHLNDMADVEFQAELVEQFVQAVGLFPTGSLVELSTGEVAVVTEQNRVQRLRPKIMIVLNEDKTILSDFRAVDLRSALTDESGEQSLWIARGLPPGAYGIDPGEFFL